MIRAAMLVGLLDVFFIAMPRPMKRILRKVIEIVQRTQLIKWVVSKLGDLGSILAERKTVLVVSHQGSGPMF